MNRSLIASGSGPRRGFGFAATCLGRAGNAATSGIRKNPTRIPESKGLGFALAVRKLAAAGPAIKMKSAST